MFHNKWTVVYLLSFTYIVWYGIRPLLCKHWSTYSQLRNLIINFLDLMKDQPSFVFHGIILGMTIGLHQMPTYIVQSTFFDITLQIHL